MTLFASSGLRFKVLLPIGKALVLICIGGFLSIFLVIQSHLDDMIEEKIASSRELFTELLDIEADNLQGLAESYVDNLSYIKAFWIATVSCSFMKVLKR